jgi:argininosuccinate lyase
VKGLPLSYNRDLQETQEPLFDSSDTLDLSLAAMTEVVRGLGLRPAHERPRIDSSSLATDVAEELVRRGAAFRAAHEQVAKWSRLAAQASADLRDVVAAESRELRSFVKGLTPESAVRRRDLPGGTAPRRVRSAIARTRRKLVVPPPSPSGRGAG